MALEDAIVLAKALRGRNADPAAAFADYEKERRPRAEKVVELGRRSGGQKRRGRIATLVQMMLMPLFLRLAPTPRWLYGHEVRWDG